MLRKIRRIVLFFRLFMEKRTTILGASLLVLILISLFYFFNTRNNSEKVSNKEQSVQGLSYDEMTGRISEVKNNTILVSWSVGSENETIEFTITPETVLRKEMIVVSAEQAGSGKSYTPETKMLSGQISDLKEGMLVRVKAKENLVGVSQAEALELSYITYDLPF